MTLHSNDTKRCQSIRPFWQSQSLRPTLCSENFSPPNYGQSESFHPLCQIGNHNRDCSHSPTVHDNGAIAVWLCGRDAFKRQITSNPIWWEGHQACSSTCVCVPLHTHPEGLKTSMTIQTSPHYIFMARSSWFILKTTGGTWGSITPLISWMAVTLRAPLHLYKSYSPNKISGWT